MANNKTRRRRPPHVVEPTISFKATINKKKEASRGAYHLFANNNQHNKQEKQEEGDIKLSWSLPSLQVQHNKNKREN
eukprot:8109295-Ditylum_brightwellii.AAC.1